MEPSPGLNELKLAQKGLNERLSQLRGRRLEISRDEIRAAEHAVAAACHAEAGKIETQLRTEIHALLTRCERAERLLQHSDKVEEDALDTEKRFRALQAENLGLQEAHHKLGNQLHETEARLHIAEKGAQDQTSTQHRLRSRCCVLENSLNQLELERNSLDGEIAHLKSLLTAADEATVGMRGSIAALAEEKAQADAARRELAAKLASMESEKDGLVSVVRCLETEMQTIGNDGRRRVEEKDTALAALQLEIATLKEELAAACAAEGVLRARIDTERQTHETHASESASLLTNVSQSKEEASKALQKAADDLRHASAEYAALKSVEEELRSRLSALTEDLARERDGRRDLQSQMSREGSELREARSKERAAVGAKEVAESLREESENAVLTLKADNAALRSELGAATRDLQNILADLARERKIADGLRAATQHATELRSEKEALETELALSHRTQQHGEETRGAEIRRLTAEVSRLSEALAVKSSDCAALSHRLDTTERELREETSVVEKLSQRLESAQDYQRQHATLQLKHDALSVSYHDMVERLKGSLNLDSAVSELRTTRESITDAVSDAVRKLGATLRGMEKGMDGFNDAIARQHQVVSVLGAVSQDVDSAVTLIGPGRVGGGADAAGAEQVSRTLARAQGKLRTALVANVSRSDRLHLGLRDTPKEGHLGEHEQQQQPVTQDAPPMPLTSASLGALRSKLQGMHKAAEALDAAVKDMCKGAAEAHGAAPQPGGASAEGGAAAGAAPAGGGGGAVPSRSGTPVKGRLRRSSIASSTAAKPVTPRASRGSFIRRM